MADPTPLSPEEQKTLDELNARNTAYQNSQKEQARLQSLESLQTAKALADILSGTEVQAAIEAVIKDAKVDYDTKARVQSMKATLNFNVNEINSLYAQYAAPVVITVP